MTRTKAAGLVASIATGWILGQQLFRPALQTKMRTGGATVVLQAAARKGEVTHVPRTPSPSDLGRHPVPRALASHGDDVPDDDAGVRAQGIASASFAAPAALQALSAGAGTSATGRSVEYADDVLIEQQGAKTRISCPPCATCPDPPPCSNPSACPTFTDPIDAHLTIASVDYHGVEAGARRGVRYLLLVDHDAPRMTVSVEPSPPPNPGAPIVPPDQDEYFTITVDRDRWPKPISVCAIWDGMQPAEPHWATCASYPAATSDELMVIALRVTVPQVGNGKPFYVVGGPAPEFNVFVYDGGKLVAAAQAVYAGGNVDVTPEVKP